ncbi:MAG: RNA polymerase sigma factor [Solirubrobacteraceae bacterium]
MAEVEALYAGSAGLVRGHVRNGVTAPEAVIEDACQVAWSRLLHHRDRVSRDRAVAWVIATAVHEAFRLTRRSDRELSLEAIAEESGDLPFRRAAPAADEAVEPRLRLELLHALPERQQRLLWLQGLGFDYREMAAGTGATVRTVERQLARARCRLRRMEEGVG